MKADQSYWIESLKDRQTHIDELLRFQVDGVTRARKSGLSWLQIGRALGVTRQAAQQKYGPLIEEKMEVV